MLIHETAPEPTVESHSGRIRSAFALTSLTGLALSLVLAADQAQAAHPSTVGSAKARIMRLLGSHTPAVVDVNRNATIPYTTCKIGRPVVMKINPKGPLRTRSHFFGFIPNTAGELSVLHLGTTDQVKRERNYEASKYSLVTQGGTSFMPELFLDPSEDGPNVITMATAIGSDVPTPVLIGYELGDCTAFRPFPKR